jgi:hypothetical protein
MSGELNVPATGSKCSLVMASLKVRPTLAESAVTDTDFSNLALDTEVFPLPLNTPSSTTMGMTLE